LLFTLIVSAGMRGRLAVQSVFLLIEGILVLVFARTTSLPAAIVIMVFFSGCVQAAEGSTYGIVPYVDPAATGSISGIVGAGGNSGAVGFGLGFRQLSYAKAFDIMGFCIIGSSFLTGLIMIKGYASLFCGQDDPDVKQATLNIPEPGEDEVAEEA
jgi:NNP family nitrate/nitrite transporter-like MFS transporter